MTEKNMTYEKFIVAVKEEVSNILGEEYDIQLNQMVKNNGINLDTLLIYEFGQFISPNIYLLPYYEQYQQTGLFSHTISKILSFYKAAMNNSRNLSLPFELDWTHVKEHLVFRLINRKKNESLLETVPHLPLFDLAITFLCVVSLAKEELGSIRITKNHCLEWGITTIDLMNTALKNTPLLFPARLCPMEDIIHDLVKSDCAITIDSSEHSSSKSPDCMYVLTNSKGMNGASCLLYPDMLSLCEQVIGGSFYILPSSIHEVILVPKRSIPGRDKESLTEMVKEINATQVAEDEILSDTVYDSDEFSCHLLPC